MTEDWLAIVDWGKFQRDHVLHQPLCGYIVLKLLGESPALRLQNDQTLLDACVDRVLTWHGTAYLRDFLVRCGMHRDDPLLDSTNASARAVWRILFRETAYVAAIFHDVGYPWQYSARMSGNLDGLNAPALHQNRSALQVVEMFGHRLLFHALHGYRVPDGTCPSTWRDRIAELVSQALTTTHGLPGALGFLYLALNENLAKCASYAAFLRTRNWVLVAASRCAFSSK